MHRFLHVALKTYLVSIPLTARLVWSNDIIKSYYSHENDHVLRLTGHENVIDAIDVDRFFTSVSFGIISPITLPALVMIKYWQVCDHFRSKKSH